MEYRFIDFFCGAGGFSEGFRQQGFKPIRGIDSWQQAINTHNFNFGLNDNKKNILDFENDEEIEKIEDSEIILGSPPCVSFSMANKAGKADKSLGIRLIESYLRVVAIKKHKKDSILISWFMENVPNSKNFVKEQYTFEDLNLSNWAEKNSINKKNTALNVKLNGGVLNSSNYASPQKRERFICGEFIERNKNNIIISEDFIYPVQIHNEDNTITLSDIKKNIPKPISNNLDNIVIDPNYPSLKLTESELTDHFYDSGLYKIEWEKAQRAKINHPFMGKMSFPENENKPSRTIMATKSGSTRESLIYKSDFKRKGNGEYRSPTIREASTLMGFPYVFNFTGTESTKWKQIGNAVCPHVSFALAESLRNKLGLNKIKHKNINFDLLIENNKINNLKEFNNLNNYKEKVFNKAPTRRENSKFRRHFFKGGNMTIALMNHSENDKSILSGKNWYMYVFLGSGKNFNIIEVQKNKYQNIENFINNNLSEVYSEFIKESKKLCINIPSSQEIQTLYIENNSNSKCLDAEKFIEQGSSLIEKYYCEDLVSQNLIQEKEYFPIFQILSLYLINLYISKIK